MTPGKERLIVALDVPTVGEARELIATLGESVGGYKIGLELLFAGGFALAQELAGAGSFVFVDAKLLDIEATVERATAVIAATGAAFLTVHALDRKTLDAAVRGRGASRLKLLGVTVLTNLAPSDLIEQGIDHPLHELVLHRTLLAKQAGFDGVVASGHEAEAIREAAGPELSHRDARGEAARLCHSGAGPRGYPGESDRGRRGLSCRGPAHHPRCRPARRSRGHRRRDRFGLIPIAR